MSARIALIVAGAAALLAVAILWVLDPLGAPARELSPLTTGAMIR